ncbi:metallophosphoesterase [Pigmentiphaga humi]|nr:metallophosphoesterase [Pigmentiphaga humi]
MFFGLIGLVHLYVGVRLVPALLSAPWLAGLLGAFLLASVVLMPASMLLRRQSGSGRARLAVWAGLLCMGLFSSLFVLTLARDVALLARAGVFLLSGSLWGGPGLVPVSAYAVVAAALAMSAIGFFMARRPPAVLRVDVPLAGLPAELHGFRIAQLSDVHVGPTIRARQVRAMVNVVNRLEADMVALTGDLVDGSVEDLADHVRPLAQLVSRHGTFFVTGNHEYYAGAQAWVDFLREAGLRVLLNEHAVLRHGGAPLVVAGIADYGAHHFLPAHRSDPAAALAGAPPGAPKLLLAHQPRSCVAAAEAGADLQLSGHTHGGQFLPWNFFVPLQQPFVAGLHRVGRMWLYINRGSGYWGPPTRFGVPSEITLLRLVPAGPDQGKEQS